LEAVACLDPSGQEVEGLRDRGREWEVADPDGLAAVSDPEKVESKDREWALCPEVPIARRLLARRYSRSIIKSLLDPDNTDITLWRYLRNSRGSAY